MSRNPNAPLELAAADRSRTECLMRHFAALQESPLPDYGYENPDRGCRSERSAAWWCKNKLLVYAETPESSKRTQSSSKSPSRTHWQPPSAEHYRTMSQNNSCSAPSSLDPPQPHRQNNTHSGWSVEGCRWRRSAWRWRWWSRTIHPGVPPCPWPAGAPGTGPGSPCPCRARPCAEYLRDRRGV